MNVIGYLRVSTTGQAIDGISLDAQREKIELWAKAHDAELLAFHIDAISGGRVDNRPALQKALSDACECKGVLVVYSLSRLARSTRDTLNIADTLQGCGADLVSLSERIDTTSAAGKMVFRMLAVLNEFEKDIISERTSTALAYKRGQGQRISGRIPYGFDLGGDGKTLVHNDEEQRAVQLMIGLREHGYTFREIVARLQKIGIPSKSGGTWSPETVRGVLRRAPLYEKATNAVPEI